MKKCQQRAQLDSEIARFASRSSAMAGAKSALAAPVRAAAGAARRGGGVAGRAAAAAAAAAGAKQSGAGAAAAAARGEGGVAAVRMHAMCSFCGNNLSLPHLLRTRGDGASALGQAVPGVVAGCASCKKVR